MSEPPKIRFEDGAGYERMMGRWSQLAGETFLDWLAPGRGLRWADIGCGNGAFTELLVGRCAAASVEGVDPSDAQLNFARQRPAGKLAHFQQGDAQALPFADAQFDAAVMALVLFFVPDPVKGVAEMARVVRPGGVVAAYAWDILAGGFPLAPLQEAMREMGMQPIFPPSVEASRASAMSTLWTGAGLVDVQTTEIRVRRSFESFDELWEISQLGSSVGQKIRSMSPEDVERLKDGFRSRVEPDATGRITLRAWANAVKGRVPMTA